jgi:hypothetical protein
MPTSALDVCVPEQVPDQGPLIDVRGKMSVEAQLLGLELGTGVERDEIHNSIGEPLPPKEGRAVERMKPHKSDVWGVPDIVEPKQR